MGAVGWAVGNISVSRNDYNITTDHAVRIRDQVEKIHKQVEKVKDALKEIKPTPNDRELPNFAAIEKLSDIDFKEPDITRDLFHTNYFSFEPTNVQQVFQYYNDTTLLSKQLAEHVTRTQKDKDTIEKFVKANQGKQKRSRWGHPGLQLEATAGAARRDHEPAVMSEAGSDRLPGGRHEDALPYLAGGEGQLRAVKGAPRTSSSRSIRASCRSR